MKNLLIDTNIVIDLLARREAFYNEAAQLFSLADKGEINLYVSSLTLANTNYILSRLLSRSEARSTLMKFKVLVRVVSLDEKVIDLALSDNQFLDFEDGLQYYSALENHLDLIITRNKKDFKHSTLPVLSSREYIALINQ